MNITEMWQRIARNGLEVAICAATTALLGWDVQAAGKPRPPKPNIIFILSDDLGYGDLGCYGQKRIQTPNLDRMAAEGMRFNQFYAGSTVCAPSRCALLTGKHIGRASVRGNVEALVGDDEPTLGNVLRRAGYRTIHIGKWGIGHPPPLDDPSRKGFDYSFGYLSMWHAHNSWPDFLYRNGELVPLQNGVRHPATHYQPGQEAVTGVATNKVEFAQDVFTADALRQIAESRQPFFLFLNYTAPHANNEAPGFGAPGIEVPDLGIYAEKSWPDAEKRKAALITRMDSDIGRILAELKELAIDDKTLVMFTSDNGPHKEGGVNPEFFASSGPLKGTKRDLYEGGIRVPLIVRWPGKVKAGSWSDFVGAFWDVLPTLAVLGQTRIPNGLDGISFVPTLVGRKQPRHAFLYWEFHEGSSKQAVRMGEWKAVRLRPSAPIELYNLETDLGETDNVADQHPEIVKRAATIMREVRTNEDRWPLRDEVASIPF